MSDSLRPRRLRGIFYLGCTTSGNSLPIQIVRGGPCTCYPAADYDAATCATVCEGPGEPGSAYSSTSQTFGPPVLCRKTQGCMWTAAQQVAISTCTWGTRPRRCTARDCWRSATRRARRGARSARVARRDSAAWRRVEARARRAARARSCCGRRVRARAGRTQGSQSTPGRALRSYADTKGHSPRMTVCPRPRETVSSMPSLRSELHDLATNFASDVLAALRSASVDEILAESGRSSSVQRARVQPTAGRAVTDRAASGILGGAADRPHNQGARRPSRSPQPRRHREDAGRRGGPHQGHQGQGAPGRGHQEGSGARPPRDPARLRQGLATKKLKSKGQKRATRYFVA